MTDIIDTSQTPPPDPSLASYVDDLAKNDPVLEQVADKVREEQLVVPNEPPPPPVDKPKKSGAPKGMIVGLVAMFFLLTTGLAFVFVNQQQSLNDIRNQAANSLYPPIYNSCITLCQGNQTCITSQCLPLLNPTPTTVDPKTPVCGNQMNCPDGWECTGSTVPGTSGSFTLKYCEVSTTVVQCSPSGACPEGYSCTGPQVPGTLNSYCMLNTPAAGNCPAGEEYSVKARKCIKPKGDCDANTSGVAASIGVCCVPPGGTSYNDGTGNYNPATEPVGGPFAGDHWTTCAAGYTCRQTEGCFKAGGGGGTPPPGEDNTPTPTKITAQCNDIKIYKDGIVVVPSTLRADDDVVIAVTGGNATKARVRINGGSWHETSTKNANGEYTYDYTVESGVYNFTIESEIYGLDNVWH